MHTAFLQMHINIIQGANLISSSSSRDDDDDREVTAACFPFIRIIDDIGILIFQTMSASFYLTMGKHILIHAHMLLTDRNKKLLIHSLTQGNAIIIKYPTNLRTIFANGIIRAHK